MCLYTSINQIVKIACLGRVQYAYNFSEIRIHIIAYAHSQFTFLCNFI